MSSRSGSAHSPSTVLVCMPWHELSRPSLAVGVLRASCVEQGLDAPSTYYGTVPWAETLLDAGLEIEDYQWVSETGFPHGLGDWVFAGALADKDFGLREMARYAEEYDIRFDMISRMRDLADAFVDRVVDDVLALNPNVVGFTSTFSQNVPSLAVARRIKQRAPDVLTVFGGYNCEGVMGATLHREFPFVDLVLRGESDETFPSLLRALETGTRDLAGIPGLCWRSDDGEQRVSPRADAPVTAQSMRTPLYSDWFQIYENSVVSELLEPELVIESSRGCWWGEKHHCTFCGLNGATMAFRAKKPTTFVTELDHLVRQYKALNVVIVDNILDISYFRTVLPQLADMDVDWRLHYEIKANITAEQAGILRRAKVWSVQPGIESLVDDVLRLMDKGISAVHNLRALRDLDSEGITTTWNWLYGFPGEREQAYFSVVEQLAALVHIQPPIGISRIVLQRFSPNFDNLEIGFRSRTSANRYRNIYPLPDSVLRDLVYEFDTPDQGLSEQQVLPLKSAILDWQEHHPASSLVRRRIGDVLVIRDRRFGWPHTDHIFADPHEVEAWEQLEYGRTIPALQRELSAAGLPWKLADLVNWLQTQHRRGLLFNEGGRWLALATAPRKSVTP